jgi:hypothetical protein
MPPCSVSSARCSCSIAQAARPRDDPVAELRRDLERLRAAAERVRVEQAREDFMQRVVRRPDLLALLQPVEEVSGNALK